jgi:hypothetical protein
MTSSTDSTLRDTTGTPVPLPAGRLPDFFLAGHSKSGTTALYEMLRSHPQIFMPDLKEPVFFAKELPRQAHRYEAPGTLEGYMALFEPAAPGQIVGEASACYLWSRVAAAEIAAVCPQAKVVAILREPASFLRSLHLQNLQSHYEDEPDLGRALALEEERREGRSVPPRSLWPQVLLYSEHVRYAEQLRRYHEVFPPEQVLVLIYDDFRADNEATVSRVLRFLGVQEDAPVASVEANPTVQMRSQRLDTLVHGLSTGQGAGFRAARSLVKAVTPSGLRRDALKGFQRRFVASEPAPPDPELTLAIKRRYRPEVLAISEYLDRDLTTLWGYDDVL